MKLAERNNIYSSNFKGETEERERQKLGKEKKLDFDKLFSFSF